MKVAGYGRVPSVEEIWLVGSTRRYIIVYERHSENWRAGLPLIGKAVFLSRVLEREISLDEVFALTSLEEVSEDEV